MDKAGELLYTKGRADDPMPGTARSGPHERANAQEVAVNVAHPPRRGHPSPDMSPDVKGQGRGTPAASAYPERGSNPHGAPHQGILSHFGQRSAPVVINPDRGETGSRVGSETPGPIPKGDRSSPEGSPDLRRRRRSYRVGRRWPGVFANPALAPLAHRVWRRTRVSARGCWVWLGATNSRGYGQIGVRERGGEKTVSRSTHREVAKACLGEIPDGMMVCHTCDVKACCNPSHLYIGTAHDNARDAVRRGRAVNPLAIANAAKTHCPHGHAYTPENTYRPPSGYRICRTCTGHSAKAVGA